MCDKVILQICGMLIFTPGLCKDQKMCDNVDENCVQALGSVLDCCYNQKMYNKPVDTYPFEYDSVPDWQITKYLSDKLFSEDPFMLMYYLDKYKTQEMCDKALEFCVPENLESVVFCNDYTVLADLDSR